MTISTNKDLLQKSTVRGDIAIVGMACIFPKAPDLNSYWHNILSKTDAVGDVPPGRWDSKTYYSEGAADINKVYCKRGGYLDEFMMFDPVKYGVMPIGVEGGEPDQFLVLQVVHEALKDAGYLDRDFNGERTEFILGRGNYLGVGASNLIQRSIITEQTLKILKNLHPEYSQEELAEIRQELLGCLPKLGPEKASAFIPNLTTGRAANRLDFMGPNYTIDAACASSLIAAEIGVRDLLTGKCDTAIVGGVHICASVPFLLIFCAFQAMSFQSRIRPFDQDADGTIPGEGLGVVILKRLQEAEDDGDRIYAVIKGVGSASDGRAVSVTAPRVEGEVLAVRRAFEMAQVPTQTIRLIEAHGVGTTVGDAVEIEAMRRVFGSRDQFGPRCALGTVKSMIGHAMPAAGIAGLIKAALAVYHKVLPPTLHCEKINPKLGIENTPLYINTETRPWIHGEADFPRRAGVNAFGFGGINAHVILEEYVTKTGKTQQKTSPQVWETDVCIFHGESRQGLIQQIHDIQKFIDENSSFLLRDLAYSLNITLGSHPCRLAVVANTIEDLQQKLTYALKRLFDPQCHQIKDLKGIYFFESPLSKEGKLAFLFPGEGSQYVNMLADLCLFFPEVRSCFDKADRILLEKGQQDLPSSYIFPPPFFSEEERRAAEKHLWKMDRATEAVLIGNLAMYTLLNSLGIKPDQIVGHSAGEWSAMIFSGIIDVEEFLQNTRKLNQIYRRLSEDPDVPKATLLAVGTSRTQISSMIEQIEGTVYVANDNCPHQVVIIAEGHVAEKAVKYLRAKGIPFEILPFDRGYHTPLFRSICPHLQDYFSSFSISSPHTEVYSCNIMSPYPHDPQKILKLAVETWALPVAFRQTIENMYNSGTRIFVEVGPKGNLSAFVEDILRGKPHLAIPSNVARRSGITQLNHMMGLLSAQGVSLNFEYLYQYRSPHFIHWADARQLQEPKEKGIKLSLGWYLLSLQERDKKKRSAESKDKKVSDGVGLAGGPSNGGRENNSDQGTWPMSDIISNMIVNELSEDKFGDVAFLSNANPSDFGSPAPSSSVMDEYFQTMGHFLDTQKEMMQVYLKKKQDSLNPDSVLPDAQKENYQQKKEQSKNNPDIEKITNTAMEPLSVVAIESLIEDEGTQSEPKTEEDFTNTLVELVSEKTGYPQEMIDLNLDMEADLGIDSIKRVEIIGSFREKYAQIAEEDIEAISGLKTLQQVIDLVKNKIKNSSQDLIGETKGDEKFSFRQRKVKEKKWEDLPFIGEVVDLKPGKSLVALRQVDLKEDLFLEDHRFGQKISEFSSGVGALPVIPLTISIEIMAEAASLLFPGQKLVRIEKVMANQWICLEGEGPIILRIEAEVLSPGSVQVQIQKYEKKEISPASQKPIITAQMFFAHEYPASSTCSEFVLEEERTPSHTGEEVYKEHRMFHGPRFQGIISMDKTGKNGLKAHLQTLPKNNLFRSSPEPDLKTDPFLLDAAGQLVGYWPVEYLDSGFVIFPIALKTLYIYKDTPPPLTRLRARMHIQQITTTKVLANLDIFGEDGQLWMQIIGWEDWRFYWSRQLYDFWRFPNQGTIGQPWEPEAKVFSEKKVPAFSLLKQFWRGGSDIFQDVMAYMVLSSKEREMYKKISAGNDRGKWLLGKMVAKDAVRSFWQKNHHKNFYPADIDLIDQGNSRLKIGEIQNSDGGLVPVILTAHADGAAIAVAAGEGLIRGINLERIYLENELPGKSALSSEEMALLSNLDKSEQKEEWTARLWCAKGAIAQAFGHNADEEREKTIGMKQTIMVNEFDFQTGRVKVTLKENLRRESFPDVRAPIWVYTYRENEYIIAITI